MLEGSRREQAARSGDELKIHFDFELRQVLLLLGSLAGFHDFAELAGVLAVESFLQRDGDRFGLGETDGHAEPRGGLQREPMPADQNDQRTHGQPFASTPKHGRSLAAEGELSMSRDDVHKAGASKFIAI